ncbi:response regulator, partial [Candidatus Igneacidithiobacillus taiwanensis]
MDTMILVVEDERNLRRVLAAILRAEGFSVLEAESAEEALELLQNNTPSLILSDQRLPGMPGIELLRRVKATYPAIPVIISTA